MQRFLVQLMLFLLPIALFSFVGDWFLTRSLRQSKQEDLGVWNSIFDGAAPADVLVYGSSRARTHISPRILEDSLGLSVYNLGMDGHNFAMQYMRHQVYLQQHRPPRLIVISLDLAMLGRRKDLFLYSQFLPHLHDSLIWETCQLYQGFSYSDRYFPLVRYVGERDAMREALLVALGKQPASSRYKGYLPHQPGDYESLKKQYRTGYTQLLDTLTLHRFGQFLGETKAQGIPVILVFSPEYLQDHAVFNRSDIMLIYRRFADAYGVPLYDFSTDAFFNSRKDYFYDPLHLNIQGAELFTAKYLLPVLRDELR